jgi:hypothetical protein
MATIDLKIIADSSDAVQEINKVTEASKTMQRTVQEGEKRQKGLIEDTIDALKKYEAARNKAMTTQGIEYYNKKIAEGKQELKKYEEAGVSVASAQKKIASATDSLWKSFIRVLAPIITVTAAFRILKDILNTTQASGDKLKEVFGGLKTSLDTFFRAVATGNFKDLKDRIKDAGDAGKKYVEAMDNVGNRERELSIIETKRKGEMVELAKIYRNTGLKGKEGYEMREKAAKQYIDLAMQGEADSIELLKMRLDAELILAREQAGFTQEYKNASEARKNAINEEILSNLTLQTSFEEHKTELDTIAQAYKNIDNIAGGTFGNEEHLSENLKVALKSNREEIAKQSPEMMKLYGQYVKWGNITDDTRQRITDALNAIGQKHNEVAAGTIRANTMAELSGVQLAKEEEKIFDERQKKFEEFIKAIVELEDEYDKSQIDKLEGNARFAAERDYQLKQIKALKTHLESLGTLTEEHYKWIASLEENVNIEFLKKSADYDQKAYDEMVKHGDNVRELDRQLQEEALDLITDNEEEKLKLKIKFAEEDIKLLEVTGDLYSQEEIRILKQRIEIWKKEIEKNKEGFDFWKLIGITDPEQQGKLKEDISIAIDNITGMLDQMYSARVDDAQRNRELIDDQIGYTTDALNAEIELAKAGYANNVDAKRKELAELEKQRKDAIKKEEDALKAQQKIESAYQSMSLVSATAGILKGYSDLPVIGQILAIAAIASMFAAFASAKVQAAKAAKLAEGGVGTETGIIAGKSHQQGGERFLDHVEVERGEMWGVLSKSASAKHGREFAQIVTSFNKDNLIIERQDAPTNNILVDVNQTNSRLDKVEYQLIKLNRHFGNRKEVHETSDVRIEKIGNKTRIIRK